MNKTFAFMAVAILLASFILPVVESEEQMENNKTIEVPVKIYTLNGVKEIKKELPVNEAKEIFYLSNKTAEAVKILMNQHTTLKEKIRANEIIDSFLYKMKEYGLLGDLTIKQAKELITGKYLIKERNSIEMRKMMMMANFLNQNGWKINAMCYFNAWSVFIDYFPWNLPLVLLIEWSPWSPGIIAAFLWDIFDAIPHPTTIGYWQIDKVSSAASAGIHVKGLLGEDAIYLERRGESINAITVGFTGINIWIYAIGFCPFIAYKYNHL